MSVRAKLTIAIVIVVAAILLLITRAVTHASSYYMTVNQLLDTSFTTNQSLTVSGNIVGKTVSYDSVNETLKFSIKDDAGGKSLPVVFHGVKPDDFENGWPVIVTGHLTTHETLAATQILIKCPSKYTAKGSETWHAKS